MKLLFALTLCLITVYSNAQVGDTSLVLTELTDRVYIRYGDGVRGPIGRYHKVSRQDSTTSQVVRFYSTNHENVFYQKTFTLGGSLTSEGFFLFSKTEEFGESYTPVGKWMFYDDAGNLKSTCKYVNGDFTEDCKWYRWDGKIIICD